jgi:hypothetical protein
MTAFLLLSCSRNVLPVDCVRTRPLLLTGNAMLRAHCDACCCLHSHAALAGSRDAARQFDFEIANQRTHRSPKGRLRAASFQQVRSQRRRSWTGKHQQQCPVLQRGKMRRSFPSTTHRWRRAYRQNRTAGFGSAPFRPAQKMFCQDAEITAIFHVLLRTRIDCRHCIASCLHWKNEITTIDEGIAGFKGDAVAHLLRWAFHIIG